MSFYNFLITLIRLLLIITFYQRFVLYTHTHTQKELNYNFLREFQNYPCNTNVFPVFPWDSKSTSSYPSNLAPLLAQNVLEQTLVLCIVFIADFFSWIHVERFQSTEVRQFCDRLRVIGRSLVLIINRVVDAAFYI